MLSLLFTRVGMMIQPEIDVEQSKNISTKLADEAWQQLGGQPLAALTLTSIAQRVGVDITLARAVAGDTQQLVLRKIAALDDQAVLESFADIEDAGEISIREKILEALMHRFEVYAPYRAQIRVLSQAARRQPEALQGQHRPQGAGEQHGRGAGARTGQGAGPRTGGRIGGRAVAVAAPEQQPLER